jgi:hypothetical protein
MQLHSFGFKNNHGNGKFGDVLLECEISISSKENVEFVLNGQRQEFAVFDSGPAHFWCRNCKMPGQRAAQTPIKAFVDQDAHRSDKFEHLQFTRFDDRNYLFAFDGRKSIQKIFD